MLLIVIPVCFMTIGSVLVRSDLNGANWQMFERENSLSATPGFEGIDAVGPDGTVLQGGLVEDTDGHRPLVQRGPFTDDQLAALRSAIGDRGEVLDVTEVYSEIATPTTNQNVRLAEWPAGVSEPVAESALAFDTGRYPTAPNEVLLSRSVADTFGVNVGDELVLSEPQRRWEVAGIARSRSYYGDSFVFVGSLDRSDIVAERLHNRVLVLPSGDPSLGEVEALGIDVRIALNTTEVYVNRWGSSSSAAREDVKALAWGWIGGVVSLIAVGVVISAAFATSARRQLATVGQLSANGAPTKVIERSLALQGSWTGVLGSTLGIGLGLLLVLGAWGQFEELVGYDLHDRNIALLDLAVIAVTATFAATMAALFPAKSAARVPVLTALAGRRPAGEVPRWLAPLGLLASAAGLGLLALVAIASRRGEGGDLAALVAVVGSVFIVIGLLCISPVLLEIAGRIGRRWPGSLLIAVRSLVRQRTRSSAVVSAIAVVMALTTAGLTGLGIAQTEVEAATITNRTIRAERAGELDQPISEQLVDQVDAVVPDAERIEVQSVRYDPNTIEAQDYVPAMVVASADVLPLLGLSDSDVDRLQEAGIGFSSWTSDEFGSALGVDRPAVLEPNGAVVVWFEFVVTPEWAAQRDLDPYTSAVLWINDTVLSADQIQQTNELGGYRVESAFLSVLAERPPSAATTNGESMDGNWYVYNTANSGIGFPWGIARLVALGAALLLVSGVVAIGLGLAAVESRDERSVLHVAGARPSVLRRVAAAKTWVLTTLAAVVAVPTGFIAVGVFWAAGKDQLDPQAGVPWIAVMSLLIIVPIMATAASWIGSAVASRLRPVTASRMRLD